MATMQRMTASVAVGHVRRVQQVGRDPDEGGTVADAVEGRVVEGAEPGGLAPRRATCAVQGVHDAAQQEDEPAGPDVPEAEEDGGDHHQQGADGRDGVGPDAGTDQPPDQRTGGRVVPALDASREEFHRPNRPRG